VFQDNDLVIEVVQVSADTSVTSAIAGVYDLAAKVGTDIGVDVR